MIYGSRSGILKEGYGNFRIQEIETTIFINGQCIAASSARSTAAHYLRNGSGHGIGKAAVRDSMRRQ